MALAAPIELDIREAELSDVDALLAIEDRCFDSDRLTRRSFRHWIKAEHGILLVAQQHQKILGYGLVWCHQGTRLARLYSLASLPEARGQGVARQLLSALEKAAAEQGRLFLRLEVAKHNETAIALYQNNGYRIFGEFSDYYEDHSDALRMQKIIAQVQQETLQLQTPWYCQTTNFTCGPAALMMAMASLEPELRMDQQLELDIWRQATSIFMTSGHGGCHPFGLALAAGDNNFETEVWLNTHDTLFIDGVRKLNKKNILDVVHQQFLQRTEAHPAINIHYGDINQQQIADWLQQGYAVVVLISTYQLDGKKTPHWVTVTGIDDRCLYVHDPDPSEKNLLPIDCQYLPIARADFDKMSAFGSSRLRTALAIKPLEVN
ncbi:GNAT family N-acetyltransferase/peptidase C39 family protein [Oceanicoccus sp. KOV_DT_Chl]|uniref:GNAT family N-acetyltransferase/peptidase C39 family protein n=1 Tax=Oceanicoccus sp. KOV_DT_Chl TaxID=1904639 RepID=UPI000C79EC5B|nr:GNAT family N-acetyltransferase/peptidase C39 family protein [Oceanicoccus sp. KOV_DT_Chl]